MRKLILCSLAVTSSAAFASAPATLAIIAAGATAPQITGTLSNSKSFDLASTVRNGPVLLYFISTSCPVTDDSAPHFQKISQAFGKSPFSLIGVVNDTTKNYQAWRSKVKGSIEAIPDPNRTIIGAYGVAASPSAVLVGTNGKVIKSWTGLSKGVLEDILKSSAGALKRSVPKISFAGAPVNLRAG